MSTSSTTDHVNDAPLHRLLAPLPNGANGSALDLLTGPLPNGANGAPAPEGEPSPSPNSGNGRDQRGRFTKGNRGGPGNPFARRIAALRRALCEMVTEEDMQVLCQRLVEQAKAGNWVAAKLLLAYVLGRPADAVDPDTLDLHEWRLFQQGPARPDEVAGVLDRLPLAMTCEILRHLTPCVATVLSQDMLEQLNRPAAVEAAMAIDAGGPGA